VQLNRARDGTTDWSAVWLVPLVGYVVAFVVFAVLFKEPNGERGA
jgi:paraquat-inducible protein B